MPKCWCWCHAGSCLARFFFQSQHWKPRKSDLTIMLGRACTGEGNACNNLCSIRGTFPAGLSSVYKSTRRTRPSNHPIAFLLLDRILVRICRQIFVYIVLCFILTSCSLFRWSLRFAFSLQLFLFLCTPFPACTAMGVLDSVNRCKLETLVCSQKCLRFIIQWDHPLCSGSNLQNEPPGGQSPPLDKHDPHFPWQVK